jgi:hypothetical protein
VNLTLATLTNLARPGRAMTELREASARLDAAIDRLDATVTQVEATLTDLAKP